jgi:hypothetical protein
MLSAQPKATVLGNGALLLTAGRPGVDLWVSADGYGKSWERFSMPTVHNGLVASEGHPADWKCVTTRQYVTHVTRCSGHLDSLQIQIQTQYRV